MVKLNTFLVLIFALLLFFVFGEFIYLFVLLPRSTNQRTSIITQKDLIETTSIQNNNTENKKSAEIIPESDKKTINSFISNVPQDSKIFVYDAIVGLLKDTNHYFTSNNRPKLQLINIPKIDLTTFINLLSKSEVDFVALDITDDYEKEFIRLPNHPKLKSITFGDLINNISLPENKKKETILLSYTGARAYIAANYLTSQGYSNIKVMQGGVLLWSKVENKNEKLTLPLNKPLKLIYDNVRLISKDELSVLSENTSKDIIILNLSEQSAKSLYMQTMSTKDIAAYINSLPKQRKYILQCDSSLSCWDAAVFWFKANKQINIIGYTGYTFKQTN